MPPNCNDEKGIERSTQTSLTLDKRKGRWRRRRSRTASSDEGFLSAEDKTGVEERRK